MRNLMTLLLLIILTFSTKLYAQTTLEDTNLDLLETGGTSSTTPKTNLEIKDIDRELLIDQRNADTGVALGQYNITSDASRYSLLLHFNADITQLTGITSFEFEYAKKLEVAWMEFFISKASVTFSEVTKSNNRDINLNSFFEEDLDLNKSDLLSLGGGLAYRTSFIQNLLPSDKFFETVAGHITFNQFTESLTSIKYNGFGVRADFGLHYRTNESFHFGVKMSYNLSTVRRSTEIDFDPEAVSSSERSLTLSWISLGLDLSYYF